jgi:hypothetical protein
LGILQLEPSRLGIRFQRIREGTNPGKQLNTNRRKDREKPIEN